MQSTRLILFLAFTALLSACHEGGQPHVCVENTVCDTGDPCTYGETVCGADDTAHCVVKRVENIPQCDGRSTEACTAGAVCDTGDPCLAGETVCGADGASHCIVQRIEDLPACGG
ncbi:MAG: hypothetical protein R3348_06030 [Xanthomonadales bacterium]|nr:hypothetical protein [Xanthomonadales bacterium]